MIEFMQVNKSFAAHPAVKNLSLRLEEGAFSVLIGTSGSGKSTTLKMINRLVEPDSGMIRFAGQDIREQPLLALRRRMGYAIQSIGLFPHWTVAQNIATVPQLLKWPQAKVNARIDQLMALLGLEPSLRARYPHQLSGGQQQRVSIARALARGPAVILADEPTGALDSHTSREVLGMLQDLHKQGNTVVLITHDNSIAVQAERIIRLEDGRVVYDGDAHAPEAVVQPNFMMAEPKAGEEGTQA